MNKTDQTSRIRCVITAILYNVLIYNESLVQVDAGGVNKLSI